MKQFILTALIFLAPDLAAQNIVQVEYYFDTDPGFGGGAPVSITPGSDLDLNFNADVSGLNDGFHILFIRGRDDSDPMDTTLVGGWSQSFSKPFLKERAIFADPLVSIQRVEYFIDSDPGFGNGTPVGFSPDSVIDLNFAADMTPVGDGFHVLFVRGQDVAGNWSLSYTKPFLKENAIFGSPLLDIEQVEYFFDTDPGFGNGIGVSVSADSLLDLTFTADLTGLSDGFHTLFLRARDENNRWSLGHTKPFLKERFIFSDPLVNVQQVEYFFDTDPGFGNGTQVSFTADSLIDLDIVADLSSVSNGFHILFVRAYDESDNWTLSYSKPFVKENAIFGEPLHDVQQVEYFIDTDPGFGNGTQVPVSADSLIDLNVVADVSSVPNGIHILFVRARGSNGVWSTAFTKPFLKQDYVASEPGPNITAIDYFFTNSTSNTAVESFSGFVQSSNVDVEFSPDLFDLDIDSSYTLHIAGRSAEGLRSPYQVHDFSIFFGNSPPMIASPIADLVFDENFGTVTVADLDTVFNDRDLIDNLAFSVSLASGLITQSLSGGNVLQISSITDVSGLETVFVTATDDSSATVTDTFTVTINALNEPPVLAGIPDVGFDEDGGLQIGLNQYVTDPDHDTTEIDFSAQVISAISSQPFPKAEWKDVGPLVAQPGIESKKNDMTKVESVDVNAATPEPAIKKPSAETAFGSKKVKAGINGASESELRIDTDDLIIAIDNVTNIATLSSTPDSSGVFVVVFTAIDGDSATDSDTITVVVSPVNDAPTVTSSIPDRAESEDFTKTFVARLTQVFGDVDGDPLTFGAVNLAPGVVPVISNDSLYIRSNQDFNGIVDIDVTASDPSALMASDQFQVAVGNVNDAPTGFSLVGPADGSLTNNVSPGFTWRSADDPDGDVLSYQLEISESTDFASPVHTEATSDTSLTVSGDLDSPNEYFWRVVADDGLGGQTASTDTNQLTIDDVPPDLFIGVLISTVIKDALLIYAGANEPLAGDVTSQLVLKNSSGSVVNTTIPDFDPVPGTDLYSTAYELVSTGSLEITVTGIDLAGNSATQTRTVAIAAIQKSSETNLVTSDGSLWITAPRGTFSADGYLVASGEPPVPAQEFFEKQADVPGTFLRDQVMISATTPAAKLLSISMRYDSEILTELVANDEDFDERKVGIYELIGDTWIYAGGEGEGESVSARLHSFGRIALIYNPDHQFLPDRITLLQNYPNPFNPSTTIQYGIPEESRVNLTVYNILGQKVRTLVNSINRPGFHSVVWDGRNDLGLQVGSGVYIYRISHGSGVVARKMLFLK